MGLRVCLVDMQEPGVGIVPCSRRLWHQGRHMVGTAAWVEDEWDALRWRRWMPSRLRAFLGRWWCVWCGSRKPDPVVGVCEDCEVLFLK